MSSLKNSRAWRVIEKRLKDDRESCLEALIIVRDEKEADRIRGRIMQIDEILERYHTAPDDEEHDT